MKRVAEITLAPLAGGTIGVMDYADQHPDQYFDHTEVYATYSDGNKRYILMVSEYHPTEIDIECDKKGLTEWHDLYNGWQRTSNCIGVWVCRKNGRYIIITD